MRWTLLLWAGGICALSILSYRAIKVVRRSRKWLHELVGAIQTAEQEAEVRPKSLASMERLLLPDVRRDFPEYDARLMARRVEQDALCYYRSLQKKQVLFGETQGVYSFLQRMEEAVLRNGEEIAHPHVHKAVLCNYSGEGMQRFVTYQAACQYQNRAGKTVQVRLELTYIAAGKADIEQNISVYQCPNCGAPISSIGRKVCEYCGTELYPAAPLSWMLFRIDAQK